MALEQPVIGPRQTVLLRPADDRLEDKLAESSPDGEWQVELETQLADLVDRAPEGVLRNEVVAATDAEEGSLCLLGCIDRDVAPGVARADHEHTLAAEDVRRLVAAGVRAVSLEPPRGSCGMIGT